jgi:hypothetical protein
MKISEVAVGSIVYSATVYTYDKSKPNFSMDKYVVVLPEHNIVRGFDYNGDLRDTTYQLRSEVFLSEKDALLYVAKVLQETLDAIKESYESKIEELLKQAVTKIEEAV